MCNYVDLDITLDKLEKELRKMRRGRQLKMDKLLKSTKFVNGFSHPTIPVITNKHPDEIDALDWGLIPFWAKDKSIQKSTLNARIETLAEKPSFRNIIDNRCLIPVCGFYEWQWLDELGKQKQKYHITMPGSEVFYMAGLWSTWKDKTANEELDTCTIVTTEANPLMAEIHNTKKRMPVILTADNCEAWLHGAPVEEFKHPNVELLAEKV